jgi:hypothetical protein
VEEVDGAELFGVFEGFFGGFVERRGSFDVFFFSGGVESIRTDMSESLSSTAFVFCFLFGGLPSSSGDLRLTCVSERGDVAALATDKPFCSTGEDVGVSAITFFFRRTFFAIN